MKWEFGGELAGVVFAEEIGEALSDGTEKIEVVDVVLDCRRRNGKEKDGRR